MARVKFSPGAFAGRLKKQVTKATNRKKLQTDIGEFVTNRVKLFARKGRPLNNNGRFPKLKESTIKARRAYRGKKHPAFSPAKSNLTVTGQLVDAIDFKRKSGGLFELFINKSSRRGRKEPNNRKLSGYLEKLGFVLFSKRGLNRDKKINKRIKQIVLRSLRKELKTKKS